MKLQNFDFRIWDKNKNRFRTKDCSINFHFNEEHKRENWFKVFVYSYENVNGIRDKNLWGVHAEYYKDDEAEIELFTGLKDKNGNDIYEGDILQDSKGNINVVSFSYDSGFIVFEDSCLHELNLKSLEVIGNIHKNPELLDKE
ncbi:YopX family protein [Helicobacter sp. WB40]|uniref:YopX family protein n=1 Tax=Helicobacter sp. WB40 TaxID=3004130 RepID=UPI0022EBB923|nr:YopX family protein [Helicobacter sp. WB40]MDA3966647.1 YopX family protein [Helicobacter sp. WB40]